MKNERKFIKEREKNFHHIVVVNRKIDIHLFQVKM